jgi:hypothetical protein
VNGVVADETRSNLLAALEAQLSGRASGGKACYEYWAQAVVYHLTELSPEIVMDSGVVLAAAAAAFNDISRSDCCLVILTDVLKRPNIFARTLVLMTGAPRPPLWQRVSVSSGVH